MPIGNNYIEELWVGIMGDMSHLKKSLDQANSQVGKFAGKLGAMSGQLDSVGRDISKVSIALVGMGGIAVKVFADFEQAMANTQSVIGATENELNRLTGFAREMGKTTIFTATQSAEAMYFLASAGFDTNKVIGSLQETLNLAAATQFNLAETTRIVVSTMNQFGIAAEDAGRVSNTFAAVISSTQATMDRLGESLKFVGPIAASLKIPLEQVTAAMGLLFNAGLQASQAGTNIRQALIRLQKPTKAAREAMRSLGLSFRDVTPQANDLIQIIRAFEKAGAGAATAGDELAEIFGARAVTAFQALIRQGGGALEKLQAKITGTVKAASMARIQIDTLKGSARLLLSALQELAIQVGKILAPAIRELMGVTKDVTLIFSSMPSVLKKVIVIGTATAGVLGLIVGPMLMLIAKLPVLILAFKSFGLILSGLGGPIALAIAGLAALAGAIIYFAGKERRAKKETEDNITSIKELASSQKKTAKEAKLLAEQYLILAGKTKLSKLEQNKMKGIVSRLNEIYPDLIDNTRNYNDQVIEMKRVLSKANIEIEKMSKLQKEVAEIELTLKAGDMLEQINKIKDDLNDLQSSFLRGNFSLNISDAGLLSTFADIKKQITNAVDKTDILRGKTSDLINTAKLLSDTEAGRGKILNDINLTAQKEKIITAFIEKTKAQAKNDGRDLTRTEQARIHIAEREKENWLKIEGSYTEVLKKALELITVESQREALLKQLEKIQKKGLEQPELPKSDKGNKDVKSSAELKLEERLQALLLKLRIASMKAWLDNEKILAGKSFADKTRLVGEEYKFKKFQLQKEMEAAQAQAADLTANEQEAQIARINVKKEFLNRFKELDSEEGAAYKKLSDDKEKTDNIRMQKTLEFEATQSEEGLQNYRDYLENRLSATTKYSDEWLSVMSKLQEMDAKLLRQRLQNARIASRTLTNVASEFGQAAMSGINGVANAWKAGLKRIVDMVADHYKKMLRMKVAFSLATLNFAEAATALFGVGIISGIQTAAKNAIDKAQVGAKVRKKGLLQVDPGEMIIPATVVRQPRERYEKAVANELAPTAQNDTEKALLQSMQSPIFIINNPLVDSQDFWDEVITQHYEKSLENLNKRYGK